MLNIACASTAITRIKLCFIVIMLVGNRLVALHWFTDLCLVSPLPPRISPATTAQWSTHYTWDPLFVSWYKQRNEKKELYKWYSSTLLSRWITQSLPVISFALRACLVLRLCWCYFEDKVGINLFNLTLKWQVSNKYFNFFSNSWKFAIQKLLTKYTKHWSHDIRLLLDPQIFLRCPIGP
jgi:hypothetical protein